jgi:predicted amidohydrolase
LLNIKEYNTFQQRSSADRKDRAPAETGRWAMSFRNNKMKIGLAQIKSVTGDVKQNINHHLRVLDHVAERNADLVMFPELSLCNYDPDIANSVAMEPDDIRLRPFQQFADRTEVAVGVGIPMRTSSNPLISITVFFPNRTKTIINKSYLHEDELPFFSASSEPPASILDMSKKIAVSICYEINLDAHIETAASKGMDVYLASVAKTPVGIKEARARMSIQANRFRVPVMVVNSVGTCEGKTAGGGSMVIGADGTVLNALDDKEEAVLFYDFKMKTTQTVAM